MTRFCLIHPPVTKPGQPPTGIPRLQHVLREHGQTCEAIDANLEGQLFLLNLSESGPRKAVHTPAANLDLIRSGTAFFSMNRYTKSIRELNRSISAPVRDSGWKLSLGDIQHPSFSPVRSRDLLRQAAQPSENPFFNYYQDTLLPRIDTLSPDVVGFSIVYLSQALCAFALIGLLRKHLPEVRIVIGGGLITSWMSNPDWHNPFEDVVDDCVSGPGEDFLLNLALVKKKSIRSNLSDFSDFFIQDYLSPGFVLPYATSQGCYWQACRFCPETYEHNRFRAIPRSLVTHDLQVMSDLTGPSLIHFIDNAIPPATLSHLTTSPPPAPWYGHVRFEPSLENPEYCAALRQSGCLLLQLGLESGCQSVLDRMQKGIRLESAIRILKNLTQAGITTYVYLLFGTPYESYEEACRTLQFIDRHQSLFTWISPAVFNLPRFSPEAESLQTSSFYEGDLALYLNFLHPLNWQRDQVRQFFSRELKSHPIISRILQRTPPVFTSNHAPFFVENFETAQNCGAQNNRSESIP